ncbi:MAG: hypothetical protein V4498_00600 [candidate division FCPU426 bacterium]
MQVAKAGRMVNIVMKDGSTRPLIITNVFPNAQDHTHPMVNGHLLLDGPNDRENNPLGAPLEAGEESPMTYWATSVSRDDKKTVGTWHWPERS